MRYFVSIEGEEHAVEVTQLPGGSFQVQSVTVQGEAQGDGEVLSAPVQARLEKSSYGDLVQVGGRVFDLNLQGSVPGELQVFASGQRVQATVETARSRAAAKVRGQRAGGASAGEVKSPMPGKVVKVLVSAGDTVEQGQPLVVVEAMKMENELTAPVAGVVCAVHVQAGDTVESSGKLITVGTAD
ncbi:MAG: biotin/lipoyl-binding protein [Polyangiaceae bacterium]|nr:biotin/lipoyl-binding protein [Polyangiaceae bacterium]MCW5790905.1 biotin/lipoyl-binding protein [Polyangiaceae bacterium]